MHHIVKNDFSFRSSDQSSKLIFLFCNSPNRNNQGKLASPFNLLFCYFQEVRFHPHVKWLTTMFTSQPAGRRKGSWEQIYLFFLRTGPSSYTHKFCSHPSDQNVIYSHSEMQERLRKRMLILGSAFKIRLLQKKMRNHIGSGVSISSFSIQPEGCFILEITISPIFVYVWSLSLILAFEV